MLVFGIEDGPDLLECPRRAIVQVRAGDSDVDQLRRIQRAGVVRRLANANIKGFLISAFRAAVAINATIRFGNGLAKLVDSARKQRLAPLLRWRQFIAQKLKTI